MPNLSSLLVWSVNLASALCVGLRKTGVGGLGIVSVSLFADFFAMRSSAVGKGRMAATGTEEHLTALDVDEWSPDPGA